MKFRVTIVATSAVLFAALPFSSAFAATMADVNAAYAAQDYAKVKTYLEDMIAGGDAEAMVTLGQLYQRGQGVDKSSDDAWSWTLRGVERFKTEENYPAAMAVLQPYIQAGQMNAQIEQAIILIKAGNDAQRAQGKAFIKTQAEAGNGQAQFEHAKIAYKAGNTKDEKWAARMKWLKLSAENGYAPGQNGYGAMQNFNVPSIGQKKDPIKRFEWQKKAADQGYAGAQVNIGNRYLYGDGTETSATTAFQYFEKAARQGNYSAMMALGSAYAHGQGVSQDKAAAISWYKKVYEGAHYSNKNKFEASRRMKKLGWKP